MTSQSTMTYTSLSVHLVRTLYLCGEFLCLGAQVHAVLIQTRQLNTDLTHLTGHF